MRLIDADELEKKLQEQRKLYIEMGMKGAEHLLVHDFLRYVWEAPIINPVKHGRWLQTDAWPHRVYCSECYKTYAQAQWEVWEDGSLSRTYCPNCGARMDGDDE